MVFAVRVVAGREAAACAAWVEACRRSRAALEMVTEAAGLPADDAAGACRRAVDGGRLAARSAPGAAAGEKVPLIFRALMPRAPSCSCRFGHFRRNIGAGLCHPG